MYIIHNSGEFHKFDKYEDFISKLAKLCELYDFYDSKSSGVFSVIRNWEEFLVVSEDGWQVNRVTSFGKSTPDFLIKFNGGDEEENNKIIEDVEIEMIRQRQAAKLEAELKVKKDAEEAQAKLEKNERETYERLRAKYAPTAVD